MWEIKSLEKLSSFGFCTFIILPDKINVYDQAESDTELTHHRKKNFLNLLVRMLTFHVYSDDGFFWS